MRLIDADELKEAINKIIAEEIEIDAKWAKGLKYSLKIIDNAPTVEINDKSLEIARKSIELGRKVGKLEGKLERPQGDLVRKNTVRWWAGGADMRGKEE